MPEKQIVITDLIPGKRYRMVIETQQEQNSPKLVAPSIEFVVPPAPRLISTYTPTYNVVPENWSTSTTTTTTVVGSTVNVGDTQSAQSYSHYVGGWSRTLGSRRYVAYLRTSPESIGQSQLMWADHHDGYYKLLVFNYGGIVSGAFLVKNRDGVVENFPYAIYLDAVQQKYGTYGRTGDAYSTATSSANQTLTYSRPALPATAYKNADTTSSTTTTTTGTYNHVDVTVPSEIQKDLYVNVTSGVAKIPLFFYIKNGAFYYLDDTLVGSNPLNLTTTPIIEMKKRNSRADADVGSRDYRFTIARYTKQGSTWVGEWEQKMDTYESIGPSFSRVVISQSAVRS